LAAAVGRIKGRQTSETMLFHGRHASLERDAVVLADRFSCSYGEVALVLGRGSDVVMRAHQRRAVDLRRGQRWGHADHRIDWTKPQRPAWMDETTSAGFPATIAMRELRVRVTQRGFRTRVVVVATTLLEVEACTKEELAGLSRARWHAALARRSIKQPMQLDVLRCKTPAMVRKEMWGHLLVDNLLRAAMAHAARRHGVVPRQVSLQGTRQTLAALHSLLAQTTSPERESIVSIVL
jgi:hypothetical protein